MHYPHEYLVHGVVKGPWYKATPYRVHFGVLRSSLSGLNLGMTGMVAGEASNALISNSMRCGQPGK
jgi:hypothetical protein